MVAYPMALRSPFTQLVKSHVAMKRPLDIEKPTTRAVRAREARLNRSFQDEALVEDAERHLSDASSRKQKRTGDSDFSADTRNLTPETSAVPYRFPYCTPRRTWR